MNAAEIGQMSPSAKKKLLVTLQAREIARCAESFSYFLFNYVVTKDEHDHNKPVKRVPDKAALRFIADEMQHGEDIQCFAKSRQLMISWLLCAKAVWMALYHPHSRTCFQSKKLEDAAGMIYDTSPNVARASFIMAHLPKWMQVCLCEDNSGKRTTQPYSLDQRTFSYGSIKLPNGAMVEALAQGAAQIESKVPSFLISDESTLQEEWKSAWSAAMPCITGGGRAIAVATMRLPSDYGDEIAPCDEVDHDGVMRGVARFRTKSGWAGIRLHYTSDPDKDPATDAGREWFAEATERMPGGYEGVDWQQHMEINPESQSGERCIPYWSQIKDDVVIDDLPYEQVSLWALWAGADYGMRNPSVLLYGATDYHGTLYIVDEHAAPGGDVKAMAAQTARFGRKHSEKGGVAGLAEMWKSHPLFHRIASTAQMDSTVWANNQNQPTGGLTSVAQLFTMHGVHFQPAKQRGQEADDLALNRLHDLWGGYDNEPYVPRLLICRRCTGLLSAIPRLSYQEWNKVAQDSNDLKKKMKGGIGLDYFDALKHALVSLPSSPGSSRPSAPPMSFEWLRNRHLRDQRGNRNARS